MDHTESFYCAKNNTYCNFCPKMSCLQDDDPLEEKLNDIDEFIQSELGFAPVCAGGPLTPTEINDLGFYLQSEKLSNGSHLWNNSENVESRWMTHPKSPNKVPEVEVEVQILDLKDVYDKKTKKTLNGLEYRLENSKVTVVVQASDEIASVKAYTRRCPEAAIRTHDTIGPVELEVNTLQNHARSRVVSVDLGSVYKTEDGDPVYWLEKAEVLQRNKWELIIAMKFSSGLAGNVTSRPFRVTTKSFYKMKKKGEFVTSPCKMQQLFHKITESNNSTNVHGDCRRHVFLAKNGIKKEFPDDTSALSQEFKEFSLMEEDDGTPQPLCTQDSGCNFKSKSIPPTGERIVLQPNTSLDKHVVTTYYGGERGIRSVIEQSGVPGLLKLVNKQSKLVGHSRRKANGHKSAGEDFSWSCGHCFFERRKKSTIKAHIIQDVCQKSFANKKSRGKVARHQMQRHFSCGELQEDKFHYSWKDSLSV